MVYGGVLKLCFARKEGLTTTPSLGTFDGSGKDHLQTILSPMLNSRGDMVVVAESYWLTCGAFQVQGEEGLERRFFARRRCGRLPTSERE